MTITVEQLDRPYPQHWWAHHASPGIRNRCRKQLALAASLADGLWDPYSAALVDRSKFWGKAKDDTMLISWGAALEAVHTGHRPALGCLVEQLPDEDLRNWVRRNDGDIWDLTSWYLLYEWFHFLFTIAGFADRGNEQFVVVSHAAEYAVAHADVLLLALLRGDDYRPMSSEIAIMGEVAHVAARPGGCPPPPWEL